MLSNSFSLPAYHHYSGLPENLLSLDRMLITAARVLGISAGKVD